MALDNLMKQSGVIAEAVRNITIKESDEFGPKLLEMLERHAYIAAYTSFNGNQTKVAEYLGINRGTCRKKLKKYGLI